jgi:hypothetical protein
MITLSNHFKIALSGLLALSLFLFWVYRKGENAIRASGLSNHLKLDDKETLHFSEKTHTLIVTTAKGTVKMYAKNPDVEIKKDGSVVVNRHLLGLETSPFIGYGYSDTTRLFLGDNFFHVSRFDLHGALGIPIYLPIGPPEVHRDVFFKPYIGVSYNFWSHLNIHTDVNPLTIYRKPEIGLYLSITL